MQQWTPEQVEQAGDLAEHFKEAYTRAENLAGCMVLDSTVGRTTHLYILGSVRAVQREQQTLEDAVIAAIAWGIYIAELGQTHMLMEKSVH